MTLSWWENPHGLDLPEDFTAAENARHNREVQRAADEGCDVDPSDYYCDCDEQECSLSHDDCTCPADCERHETGVCMRTSCLRIRPLAELVELEAHERWCPACFVADFVETHGPDGWDVSEFREELARHGVWMPTPDAASLAQAAE